MAYLEIMTSSWYNRVQTIHPSKEGTVEIFFTRIRRPLSPYDSRSYVIGIDYNRNTEIEPKKTFLVGYYSHLKLIITGVFVEIITADSDQRTVTESSSESKWRAQGFSWDPSNVIICTYTALWLFKFRFLWILDWPTTSPCITRTFSLHTPQTSSSNTPFTLLELLINNFELTLDNIDNNTQINPKKD